MDIALAEAFRVLRGGLGGGIGHEGGSGAANAGRSPQQRADDGPAQHGEAARPVFGPTDASVGRVSGVRQFDGCFCVALLTGKANQNFRDGQHTECDGGQRQTVVKRKIPENETRGEVFWISANGGNQQPKHRSNGPFDQGFANKT